MEVTGVVICTVADDTDAVATGTEILWLQRGMQHESVQTSHTFRYKPL
jgi:hypothetical protein